jgi:hypothetical protein
MIRIIRLFFMGMGVLFVLLLGGLGYIVVADPFHIRPLLTLLLEPANDAGAETVTTDTPASEPTMEASSTAVTPGTSPASEPTSAQREALESVGINPESVISNITPAQLACFVSILGSARVAEIKAGAVPTSAEFFSVRSCL